MILVKEQAKTENILHRNFCLKLMEVLVLGVLSPSLSLSLFFLFGLIDDMF